LREPAELEIVCSDERKQAIPAHARIFILLTVYLSVLCTPREEGMEFNDK